MKNPKIVVRDDNAREFEINDVKHLPKKGEHLIHDNIEYQIGMVKHFVDENLILIFAIKI